MDIPADKRRHVRYHIPVPVMIIAPTLYDLRLIPEDLSASGFQVVVPVPPALGVDVPCSISVHDREFKGIQAKTVWVAKNELDPSTWIIGLEFILSEENFQKLEAHLREFLGEEN
ncbi:MAG: PilZ domain-containing protein [Nitrospinota bacterium]